MKQVHPETRISKKGMAIVNNFDSKIKKPEGARYRFRDWFVDGNAFTFAPQHRFGPILWSMYTLSDSHTDEDFVLKMSALTGPLGDQDSRHIELVAQKPDGWKSFGEAPIDRDAWTATFRIPHWNANRATPYKLIYRRRQASGKETVHTWRGTIQANPADRPLRMAALTCQKDYAFPYEPVAENLRELNPDLLYFSGDQLYEDHGGYGLIRDPAESAILNYLRKFYMFGWAFREAMRDRPTVCIPDDHDVFQCCVKGGVGGG